MDKLISLQQAIDALRKMQTYKLFAGDDMLLIDQAEAQTELMMLPSAEPETNCSEIPNNSDTISRQAVTKFLNDWLSCLFENCHKQSASDLKMIIKDFKNLPSAQPAQSEMIKEIRRWINSGNRGNADYFIVDRIEEIINAYEIN